MTANKHKTHINPQAKGYSEAGASTKKRALKGFAPSSGAPNEDINWNNANLRQRGRMLYMASPVATAAIDTNRTKVVGVGLTLKSQIDRDVLGLSPEAAKIWQKHTEAEFRLWASRKECCDATGVNNFAGMQQLAMKSWLMSGDVFGLVKRCDATANRPYTLRIHLIEADRVCTPQSYKSGYNSNTDGENKQTKNKIYDGVEVDKNGMIVAYHICNTYPGTFVSGEDMTWTRVEAFGKKTGLPNIVQVMSAERPEQYRGITYLAQVIEPLLQLGRYTESELMAALVQSFFSAWITTNTDPADMPFNEVGSGDAAGMPTENPFDGNGPISADPNEYEMGPGTITHLAPDESITFGNPNIPTSGYGNFVDKMCCLIGAALELPKEVLLKEFSTAYNASRAALIEAWEAFKMRRVWFVDDFCQPIYEIWLTEAVASGRIKAPGFFTDPLLRDAWCEARWIGPVQGQLDPTKEAKAAIMNVDRGFKTHEQVTRELGGGDWEDNIDQIADENEKLRTAGGGNYMATLDSDEQQDGQTQQEE